MARRGVSRRVPGAPEADTVSAGSARGIAGVFAGFPRPRPGRPGDPGLFGPGSMVWRVNGEAATVLGGGRALLMQVAHPMVSAGVADHSDFSRDAFARLWRTLDAVLTIAFGDERQARAAAERVTEIHARVVGERRGSSYLALDPALLLWVHATLVDTALVTYESFVGPLGPDEREGYHDEMKRFAAAFRLPAEAVPARLVDLRAYLEDTIRGLEVTDEARLLARGIIRPEVPMTLLPLRGLLGEATAGLLPPALRRGFRIPWGPARERALRGAAWGVRRTLPALPAKVRRWPHAVAAEARLRAQVGE